MCHPTLSLRKSRGSGALLEFFCCASPPERSWSLSLLILLFIVMLCCHAEVSATPGSVWVLRAAPRCSCHSEQAPQGLGASSEVVAMNCGCCADAASPSSWGQQVPKRPRSAQHLLLLKGGFCWINGFGFHRIVQDPELKETHKDHGIQLLALSKNKAMTVVVVADIE